VVVLQVAMQRLRWGRRLYAIGSKPQGGAPGGPPPPRGGGGGLLGGGGRGGRLYASVSTPEAAAQAGLPTRRLVLGAFIACGALSGFAGFLFLSRFGNITVVAGQGIELDSVAAARVGGVSVVGGAWTLVGSR